MSAIRFCFIALLLLFGCSHQPDGVESHGRPINLSDFKGKWVFVNYWADWCGYCLEEMPDLNRFYEAHHSKDAVVVGISFEPLTVKDIKKFADEQHILYPMMTSIPIEKFGQSDIPSLPLTVVINPQGKVVRFLVGKQTVSRLERAMH